MIAFWGEPGAHEPDQDTALTFLGIDGRWRSLTVHDLGGELGYLSPDEGSLSPDGSRWVVGVDRADLLVDFRTSRVTRLTQLTAAHASWSPDSKAVAMWDLNGRSIDVFDRTGRRLDNFPIDLEKRAVFMPDSRHVTVFDRPAGAPPVLRFTTYDLTGIPTKTTSCAVPSGYPTRAVAVDGYDGDRLWISALVDKQRGVMRFTQIDVSTGTVVHDIAKTGWVPWVDQWVQPDVYTTSILGTPTGIHAIDPDTGDMVRISRIKPYLRQSGYENHAHSLYARELAFATNPR